MNSHINQTSNQCIPFYPDLKLNRIKELLFLLLAFLAINILNGCTDPANTAMLTTNVKQGLSAVEKLTDQSMLAKVAIEAQVEDISLAAVKKITDQDRLASVVIESESDNVRKNAFEKITDQTMFAKVAVDAGTTEAMRHAIDKLTDQTLLKKVADEARFDVLKGYALSKMNDEFLLAKAALESTDEEVSQLIIGRLTTDELLTRMAKERNDRNVQFVYRIISSFNDVPEQHRVRLISSVIMHAGILNDPDVISEIGEITAIKAKWIPYDVKYVGSISGTSPGEKFTFSVKVSKLVKLLEISWSSEFRHTITSYDELDFHYAVQRSSFLMTVLEQLSQPLLFKIVNGDQIDFIRQVAVQKLTDQSMLIRIIQENTEDFIRANAVKNITDQSLLAKIAVTDSIINVRAAAVEGLTDQGLLAKIALTDSNDIVSVTAVENLTDKAVLEKIIAEDDNSVMRDRAQFRLSVLR